MNFINYLKEQFIEEKDILEELINIDNDIMNTNITYQSYLTYINNIKLPEHLPNIPTNTLFITEGSPLLTIDILNILNSNHNYIIFINQGYIAINKWLINKYISYTGNTNVELDININYNDYINLGYKVIPIGENALIDTIIKDFYIE